uniref:Uncharacterized protein n=1 Tax=viral metagenome TaxID=1070528 RepID=A0A6C0H4K7_9ZZZZ
MSNDFHIELFSETKIIENNKQLRCVASLIYTGKNADFLIYIKGIEKLEIKSTERNIKLAVVNISFYSNFIQLYDFEYIDSKRSLKTITSTDKDIYNGYLSGFYNYITSENLDTTRFEFLKKLKGISYGMLLCCICNALKLGFITSSSHIALDAAGVISGMNEKESLNSLVEYYKKIGFYERFPELHEYNIDNEVVPMIGKVETLISNCTFDNLSKELLEILPVRMCKNICNKKNKKVLKSIKKSLLGKDILSQYKYTTIPKEILEEKLEYLKKVNKGFEKVNIEDFVLMCSEKAQ